MESIISNFSPTPTFFLGLIPLPIIITLNTVIFFKLRQVRKLSHRHKLRMPGIYRRGVTINAISFGIFLLPALTEMRIFVVNPQWFYVYMISGCLAITGQIMVMRGLKLEIIHLLNRRRKNSKSNYHPKRVPVSSRG